MSSITKGSLNTTDCMSLNCGLNMVYSMSFNMDCMGSSMDSNMGCVGSKMDCMGSYMVCMGSNMDCMGLNMDCSWISRIRIWIVWVQILIVWFRTWIAKVRTHNNIILKRNSKNAFMFNASLNRISFYQSMHRCFKHLSQMII